MIGFETIGNATLTLFDDEPILTTDPWVFGNPYFGSWGHKYIIPEEQLNNIVITQDLLFYVKININYYNQFVLDLYKFM